MSVWPKSSLGSLVDLRLSSVDKKTSPVERSVRLCNYTDVYKNSFIHGRLDFMDATATDREIANCALYAGDVVITKDSEKHDDIGVPALVRENVPDLVCGYHLAILRPASSDIDGSYLYYALNTRGVQQQFHACANGVTRFGLRKADIALVQIPRPPISEQRAIARVLCALDDKVEANRRMNATLEGMAQAAFKDWFVDFGPVRAKAAGCARYLPDPLWSLFPDRLVDSEAGEIPEGWEAVPLSQAVEINPPRSLKKGRTAPYLDMANMPTEGHSPGAVVDRPYGSGMRFVNGDTLVARITPCLENGKTAYVDFLEDGVVGWGSTEYIVMRPRDPLPAEFAYCLARSAGFREFAIQNMSGTSGRQRVSAPTLSQFVVPMPAHPIAGSFGRFAGPLMARAAGAGRESRALAGLRDTLLPRLVSGKLRVRGIE